MVFLLISVSLNSLQDLHHLRGDRNRSADSVSRVQSVVQILDVQLNTESGLEVAVHHHRSLGIHNGGSGQTAADRLIYALRVNACLYGEGQSLCDSRDIGSNDDLVRQLCYVAGAKLANIYNGSSHVGEQLYTYRRFLPCRRP